MLHYHSQPVSFSTHLPAAAATPKLAPLFKTVVDVDAQLPVVQLRTVEEADCCQGVCPGVIDHKAEAAGRLGVPVKAHDHPLHHPDLAKQLVDLHAHANTARETDSWGFGYNCDATTADLGLDPVMGTEPPAEPPYSDTCLAY